MRLRRARGRKTLVLLFLVAATLGAAVGTSAAQESVKRIAILGPAEEPRFSEVARGLRRGLGDRGYSEGALEIIPAKVARGDHAGARAAVAGLVRQGVQVLFPSAPSSRGSRGRSPSSCQSCSSRRAIRWPPAWSEASPIPAAR
jgi:ABC-type uncharacterized transport system substrate-binding protein